MGNIEDAGDFLASIIKAQTPGINTLKRKNRVQKSPSPTVIGCYPFLAARSRLHGKSV
jgi:hypothetical protein